MEDKLWRIYVSGAHIEKFWLRLRIRISMTFEIIAELFTAPRRPKGREK